MTSNDESLAELESCLLSAVFGTTSEHPADLVDWLHNNIFSLAVGSQATIEASVKHQLADSCAEGVAEQVLAAAYVPAMLHRRDEMEFAVLCDMEPRCVAIIYKGKDELTDKLLNRFAMGYFKPVIAAEQRPGQEPAVTEAPNARENTEPIVPLTTEAAAPRRHAPAPIAGLFTDPQPGESAASSVGDGAFDTFDGDGSTAATEGRGDDDDLMGSEHVPAPVTPPPPPPDPKPIDLDEKPVFEEGSRIKMSFGSGASLTWFGGLVGGTACNGDRIIGFDDGDLQMFDESELATRFRTGIICPVDASEPGLMDGIVGVVKAAAFSFIHEGGRAVPKAVGVLIGEMVGETIANEIMYDQHHVSVDAFGAPAAARTRRRASQGPPQLSQRERLGFHTFRRGDRVQYTAVLQGDPVCHAVVFAVVLPPKRDSEQGRKLLVLYDEEAKFFFMGLWTEWRRVHLIDSPEDFEDNSTAKTVDAAGFTKMMEEWGSGDASSKEVKAITSLSKARDLARQPPPAIKVSRAQAKRDDQLRKRVERKRQREMEEEQQKRLQKEKAEEEAAARRLREAERSSMGAAPAPAPATRQQGMEAGRGGAEGGGGGRGSGGVGSECASLDDDMGFGADDFYDTCSSFGSVPVVAAASSVPAPKSEPSPQLVALQLQAERDRRAMLEMQAQLQAMKEQQQNAAPVQSLNRMPAPVASQTRSAQPALDECAKLVAERERVRALEAELQQWKNSTSTPVSTVPANHTQQQPFGYFQQQQQMHMPPQTPEIHRQHQMHAQMHAAQPAHLESPPTPWSVKQVQEQLRIARNQQSVETNPEMMRQRSLFIMDLESRIGQHRHKRDNARRERRLYQSEYPSVPYMGPRRLY